MALSAAAASNNPTVYRNEVVNTLRALNPGVLRYMDSGNNWGSSIDNMLAPDFARERTGYSPWSSEMDDIPLSLPDFLVLCQTIGAEPWYTMQTGMSTQEMSNPDGLSGWLYFDRVRGEARRHGSDRTLDKRFPDHSPRVWQRSLEHRESRRQHLRFRLLRQAPPM